MSSPRQARHWHREPADSTRRFAATAIFTPTPKGLQTAIELIAYPGGQVQVVSSRISGQPGKRNIIQAAEPLMFNDIDEAKDAVDLILDQLSDEAQRSREG